MLHGWSLSNGRCLPTSDADRGMRRRPSFYGSAVRLNGSSDQTVRTERSAGYSAGSIPAASTRRINCKPAREITSRRRKPPAQPRTSAKVVRVLPDRRVALSVWPRAQRRPRRLASRRREPIEPIGRASSAQPPSCPGASPPAPSAHRPERYPRPVAAIGGHEAAATLPGLRVEVERQYARSCLTHETMLRRPDGACIRTETRLDRDRDGTTSSSSSRNHPTVPMNELAERILYSKSGFTGVVDRIEECRRQCSRAGMILPWIRRRGSGLARRAAARFRRSVAEARTAGSRAAARSPLRLGGTHE